MGVLACDESSIAELVGNDPGGPIISLLEVPPLLLKLGLDEEINLVGTPYSRLLRIREARDRETGNEGCARGVLALSEDHGTVADDGNDLAREEGGLNGGNENGGGVKVRVAAAVATGDVDCVEGVGER